MENDAASTDAGGKHFGFDSHGIPNAYRRAVTGFAALTGVDAEELIAGARMDSQGVGFWLVNHGAKDPRALTVLVDCGELPDVPAEQVMVLRDLMDKNVSNPGALCGYYGTLPETNTVTMCLRLDLQHVEEGDEAAVLCELLATLVEGVEKSREVFALLLDEIIRRTSGSTLEKV